MEAISPDLLAVVDYSIMGIPLGFIARPMIFLLDLFHGWVGSWGVAIMLLTLTVKLLLFPVTYKSMVSMRKMQMLKPELDKIKERHPNDREKQQMAQLKLYKDSGVNPLGGCLPMLLQMPVWFALYRALWTAVDLYQEPFLWLPDLTAKEPGIPLLALGLGVVFFGQQLLTPMSADTQQMKMMKWVMPIMFTFFMLALPSGLVLYIFVNTVLSIFQQLAINRTLGPAPAMVAAGTQAAGAGANGKGTRGGKRKAG
jgi:YidC/Oxa1 family membrane protein insertase